MTDYELNDLFNTWHDQTIGNDNEWLLEMKPLLSHYTSLASLEKIFSSGEVWFSNPLFMNDIGELRSGISLGEKVFLDYIDDAIFEAQTKHSLRACFESCLRKMDENALDTYVFCMSEHAEGDTDGALSMWRGYGGAGAGTAIVFNVGFVSRSAELPIIISRVNYMSDSNREERLRKTMEAWGTVFESVGDSSDNLHWIAVRSLFHVFVLEALSTKHHGFREEKEWRLIYLKEHDNDGFFKNNFTYVVTPHGVEPKLRVQIAPLKNQPESSWTFSSIVEMIILGPAASSPLAVASLRRMFKLMGKEHFCEKVVPSGIPLRAR